MRYCLLFLLLVLLGCSEPPPADASKPAEKNKATQDDGEDLMKKGY